MLGGLDWFGLMLDWGGAGWIAVVEWIIGNGVSFDPSLPGHYHALLFHPLRRNLFVRTYRQLN
jgi:hypothetical protein